MWIKHERAWESLKNNEKTQIARGRARTPDLQLLDPLWPMWQPLKHVVVLLLIIQRNNNIKKQVNGQKNKKNARNF